MFSAHFAGQFAFQNQQNLIAILVRLGSLPGRFAGASVIIAV
jgi:hypothetical protein